MQIIRGASGGGGDGDFCRWHEVHDDDDYGDSVRARPWRMIQDVNLGGRPRKQARVPQSDPRSDTGSDSCSEEHEDAASSSEDSGGDEDSGAQHLQNVDLNLGIGMAVGAVLFGN